MTSADLSADHRPIVGRSSADCQNPKTVGRWKKNYNKVVIILFLSADEKRTKIWHFIGRRSVDCRRGYCNRGFNVPVNNFSVMVGRSHLFLGITSTFRRVNVSLLKDTARRRYVSNPRPLAPESEALPLGHCAPPCMLEQPQYVYPSCLSKHKKKYHIFL